MYVYSPACGDVAGGVVVVVVVVGVEVGGWGVRGAGRGRRLESGPKGLGFETWFESRCTYAVVLVDLIDPYELFLSPVCDIARLYSFPPPPPPFFSFLLPSLLFTGYINSAIKELSTPGRG